MNLNLPIKADVKAESADVLKTADQDRKHAILITINRYVLRRCYVFAPNQQSIAAALVS